MINSEKTVRLPGLRGLLTGGRGLQMDHRREQFCLSIDSLRGVQKPGYTTKVRR